MTVKGDEAEISYEKIQYYPPQSNLFWRKNAEKLVETYISSVEDTAKQFVSITGLFQGIYFPAITLSNLKNEPLNSVLIYMSPLVLWFVSLFFAMLVLFDKGYSLNLISGRDSREAFQEIANEKYILLCISGIFLILGFAVLIPVVFHRLGMF